ncbi:MAG: transposase [Saprospiraceae bacterium]
MENADNKYVKRTQKDYSYAFKLQVIQEYEMGNYTITGLADKYGIQSRSTIRTWIKKYSNLDKSYELKRSKMKSPEQKIMELEQQLKLLKKKNRTLEKELDQTNKKAIFFDMMIDIAEKDLNISIRKKSLSNQSKSSPSKKR